jgi:3-methyladenine DNA glycosylase Mpg
LDRDPLDAAQGLLGATLFGRGVAATVVEVEAYGGVPDGPGRTPRRIPTVVPMSAIW